MNWLEKENWVFACVERLVDNFPWSEHDIDTETRVEIEEMISNAIIRDDDWTRNFVDMCLDNGIIEKDYFE
jgi:hypothetical protein